MGIRDWLAIIVIIFIVLILLDGFRRKWLERKKRIVVKIDKNIPPADDAEDSADPLLRSELPNGGARTIRRADGSFYEEETNEDVPVLMESVDLDDDEFEEYASDDWDSDNTESEDWQESDEEEWEDDIPEVSQNISASDVSVDEQAEEQEDEQEYEGWTADDDFEAESGLEQEQDDFEDDDDSEPMPAKKGMLGSRSQSEERIEPTFGDQELTFSRDDQGELDLEHNDLIDSDMEHEEDDDV